MRKLFPVFLLSVLYAKSFAQKVDIKYNEHAAEIQKEIWNNKSAPFQVTQIPEDMTDESAVIIARSFEVINCAKMKLKISLLLSTTQRISYLTTFHERVKINDKAALDDYATIEYSKKIDRSFSYGFSRLYNKTDTYIGAKIIKANGIETIVNTDEEVLIKNESKDKEGKLAI